MKEKLMLFGVNLLAGLLLIGCIAAPFVWVYATVSECGWKGLFVQCRIEARPNQAHK